MPRLYGTDRIRIEHVISSRRLAIVKLEKSSQMAPNFISTVVLFIFSRAHIIRSILISFYSGPFISLYARNKVLSFSRRERGVTPWRYDAATYLHLYSRWSGKRSSPRSPDLFERGNRKKILWNSRRNAALKE